MKKNFYDVFKKNKLSVYYMLIVSVALSFLVFFILFNSENRFVLIKYDHTHDPSIYMISEEKESQSRKYIDNGDIQVMESLFRNYTLEPVYISKDSCYDMITGDQIQASFQIENKIENTTAPLISYNQLSQFDIVRSFNNDRGVYLTTDLMEEMGFDYETMDDDTIIDLVIPIPVYNGYDKSQKNSNPVTFSTPLTIQTKISGIVESDHDLESVFHTSSYTLFPYEFIKDENISGLAPSDTIKQNYELSQVLAPAYLIKCDEEEVQNLYDNINDTLTKEQTDLIALSPYLNIQNEYSKSIDFHTKLFLGCVICCFVLGVMLIYESIKRKFIKQTDCSISEHIKSLDKIQVKQYLKERMKIAFKMLWNIFTVVYVIMFIILEFIYPKGNTNYLVLIFGYVFVIIVIKIMFFLREKYEYICLVVSKKYNQ